MDKVGNRYTPLERLGSGAMGVVWRAHDELLHRDVAIKQLLLPGLAADEVDEACRRAMREARIAARLQHPNAVGVFDVVVEDGKPCLVMEFVPSRSLSAVLAERGTLPPAEAARIGGHVASALAAAHRAGVVHRDIKPGNVLIGADGTVKITDFGISRAVGDVTVTRTGMLAGTLAYLAPELARGADPTPAADVFSLGATLYALVEGGPPFGAGDNDLGMLHRIAGGWIVPPTRSGPLTALLTRLLANDPAARPTAEQASRELATLSTPTASAPPNTPPPGTPRLTAPPPTTASPTNSQPNTPPPGIPRPTSAWPSTPPPGTPRPTKALRPAPLAHPPTAVAPPPTAVAGPPTHGAPLATTRRWLVPVLAAGVVVAVAATVLFIAFREDDLRSASPDTTTPVPTRSEPTTDYPTAEAPTSDDTTTEAPPETTEAGTLDAASVADHVRDHFANLPHDPATARENWAPENRPSEWEDDQFWGAYSDVTVSGEPEVTANGATYTADVTLEFTPHDDDPFTEDYRVVMVLRDDRLLIVDLAQA
ncbi:serine/threonine protein kinase [Saccharothrix carnea]|uniref:non-specific serine/threonine protein kinase n=1 Tax=Saccharothrix carnea TaxID=1280637 RepID=A0A2P8I2Q0_SACCR|nr:serine/threonine-protein kinase [Saccharothrix carnea]PSL52747.1 serine/threonine protein kinase [Saccharothrix carnea]